MLADLTPRHFGHTIAIPDLHQPGTDWDAPKVTVGGLLTGLSWARYDRAMVWVRLAPKSAALDTPLPLTWPCRIDPETKEQQ